MANAARSMLDEYNPLNSVLMDNPNEDKAKKEKIDGGEFFRTRSNYEGQRRFTHLEKRKNKPGKVSVETEKDLNT